MAEQEPVINNCPSCGDPINVTALPPYAKIECPHCKKAVRVHTHLGNYRIIGNLGEGGMSQVFLAEDLTLDRQVALKILHQELSKDEKLTASFEREAQLTASINHPNVVKVYTVGSEHGYFFIAMELVDNVSLEKMIETDGPMDEGEALDLLYDVTKGLRAAYKNTLIHRDIKPGNMLLTQDGTGKLVDFGLAIIQDDEDEMEELWATPFYVPPEKLDGVPDDFRGDIYSLGATFFHALAGKPPFAANTSSIEELKVLKSGKIRLSDYSKTTSSATADLIDRMMAYDPVARPQSYDELLELIGEVQEKRGDVTGRAALERRQNAGAVEGGFSWAKWGGIAAAVLIAGGIGISVLINNTSADNNSIDLSGAQDRVLATGDQSSAALYIEARDILRKGKYREARKKFNALLESGDLRQPTLAWTQFNAGLCALMGGQEPAARELFAPLEEADAFEPGQEDMRDFFRKVGTQLKEPLPVMAEDLADLDPSTFEVIGLLAYGLKNWQLEQFSSAKQVFEQFRSAPVPLGYEWMKEYQAQVTPFLKDEQLLAKLPNPRGSMKRNELQDAKKKLENAFPQFETRGAAPALAKRRAERIDTIIEAIKLASKPIKKPVTKPLTPPATTPPSDTSSQLKGPIPGIPEILTIEAEAEIEYLKSKAETLRAEGHLLQFERLRTDLAAVDIVRPAARILYEDETIAWTRAEEFLNRIMIELNDSQWEGEIPLKDGKIFNARVATISPVGIAIDFGFGENDESDLPLSAVHPSFFLEVAKTTCLAPETGSPTENLAPWVEAAFFARQTGQSEASQTIAEKIGTEAGVFGNRWQRMNHFFGNPQIDASN